MGYVKCVGLMIKEMGEKMKKEFYELTEKGEILAKIFKKDEKTKN